MKLIELLEINKALLEAQAFEKTLPKGFTRRLAWDISGNKLRLKNTVKRFQEVVKPSEEFLKYDLERVELAKGHAKKDEKGDPVVQNMEYVLEDKEAFEAELKALREKHKGAIETQEDRAKEAEALLESEEKVELIDLSLEDFPAEFPSHLFEVMRPIIKTKEEN